MKLFDDKESSLCQPSAEEIRIFKWVAGFVLVLITILIIAGIAHAVNKFLPHQ